MEPTFTQLLGSGVQLMFVGMGIVFMFLALLVWVIGVSAKLLEKHLPDVESTSLRHFAAQPEEPEEAEVVAAIAAAVYQFRNS